MHPRHLLAILAALVLAACGEDEPELPAPTPDLVITGRLIDDAGQPVGNATVEAFLVAFPTEELVAEALLVPACDEAVVPGASLPAAEEQTEEDGSFSIAVMHFEVAQCLIVDIAIPGSAPEVAVRLAPQPVTPGLTKPVVVSLGDIAVAPLSGDSE